MYKDVTETLMTTAEFKELVGKSNTGKLSDKILPDVSYMGVKYKVGSETKVYDGDHVAGNYYFKTSDGLVKVNIYGSASDVVESTLIGQIQALPGNTGASDFEYLECTKSAVFDPLYGYHSDSPGVGVDTLGMGAGSMCEADYSYSNGPCMYIDSGSSYVNVLGNDSVLQNSHYVMGAVADSFVKDAFGLFGHVRDSRLSAVTDTSVHGGIVMNDYSVLEQKWSSAMGVPRWPGYLLNSDIKGTGNEMWGSADDLKIRGSNNHIGWFSEYAVKLPGDTTYRSTMGDIEVNGYGNWVGFNSSQVNVTGSTNYIAAGSKNVNVIGDHFNEYYTYPSTTGSQKYHARGMYSNYEILTDAEAQARIDADQGMSAIVVGDNDLTYTHGGVSYSIVAHDSATCMYIGWAGKASTSAVANSNRKTMADGEVLWYTEEWSWYQIFPSNQKNVLSIGDYNTLPDGAENIVLWGDKLIFDTATISDSVFVANHMRIGGPKKMKVGDEVIDKNIIRGVWWIDTNRNTSEGGSENGCLSDMNANEATPSFTDAFVFTNSGFMYNGRFYGTMTKSEALSLGFGESQITGSSAYILDGVSGYITEAAWYNCKKPDTPMIYTGGLALYGGANSSTRNQSAYGVLKLGNMYYHDNTPADQIPSGYVAADYRRLKTEEYIKSILDGKVNTGNIFKGAVVMTPGTDKCPYAGMSLIVQDRQELDGSFHIGVGYPKLDVNIVENTLLYDHVRKITCSYVGTLTIGYQEYYDGSQIQQLSPKVTYPDESATTGSATATSTADNAIVTSVTTVATKTPSGSSYTESMAPSFQITPKANEMIVIDPGILHISYTDHTLYVSLVDPSEADVGKVFYLYMYLSSITEYNPYVTAKCLTMTGATAASEGTSPAMGTRSINLQTWGDSTYASSKNVFLKVSVKKANNEVGYFFERIPLPS